LASNIYMRVQTSNKWLLQDGNKCCEDNESHYAIIAKGNILVGIEAKE